MFQKAYIFLIIFLTAIFQISIFSHFFSFGIIPDLLLILIIIWTINEGFEKVLWRIILAGFILDIFSYFSVGVNIICLVVVAYLVSFLAKRFLTSSKTWKTLFFLVAIAISTIVYHLLINGLVVIFSSLIKEGFHGEVLRVKDSKIFAIMLYNLAIFFLMYWPLGKLERFLSMYSKGFIDHRKTPIKI